MQRQPVSLPHQLLLQPTAGLPPVSVQTSFTRDYPEFLPYTNVAGATPAQVSNTAHLPGGISPRTLFVSTDPGVVDLTDVPHGAHDPTLDGIQAPRAPPSFNNLGLLHPSGAPLGGVSHSPVGTAPPTVSTMHHQPGSVITPGAPPGFPTNDPVGTLVARNI